MLPHRPTGSVSSDGILASTSLHRRQVSPLPRSGRCIVTIPGVPGHPPPLLVGREREQSILRDHLTAARAGQGSLVLIGGEAGTCYTAPAQATRAHATAQRA